MMASRIGALRSIHAVRALRDTTVRKGGIFNDVYANTICRRCLSTTRNIYQRYFTEDHEWIEVDDLIGKVGITDHAQEQLGDIVFVELPDEDDIFTKDDVVGTIESVKAASDVLTPVSGSIIQVNEDLITTPGIINSDPNHAGWMFEIQLSAPEEVEELMSEVAYKTYIASAGEE